MGLALKCDICGTYFDYDSNYIGIVIKRYNRYDTEMVRKEETLLESVDMCPDCYNAIMKTIDDRRLRSKVNMSGEE